MTAPSTPTDTDMQSQKPRNTTQSKMQRKRPKARKRPKVAIMSSESPSLQPWNKLPKDRKLREIVRFAKHSGGRAVTLNPSPQFLQDLAQSSQPMCRVRKRMHTQLRKFDLHRLPVLMVLEATRDSARPHLHGVFIAPPDQTKIIQAAMRNAVGYIDGRSGSRQFYSRPIYEADGWSNYIKKDRAWTRRILDLTGDERLWWSSHSITQLTREHYEKIRKATISAANTNATLSSPAR